MSDADIPMLEEQIRAAVRRPQPDNEEAYRTLRATVRGTLIQAHRELIGPSFEWLATDDRMLDIVTAWLEQCRDRGQR